MSNLGYIDLENIEYEVVELTHPWGVRVSQHQMLGLFVVARGTAWFQTDSKFLPRVELGPDDIVGTSAGIGYTISSAPDVPQSCFIDSDKLFEIARDRENAENSAGETTQLMIGRVQLKKQSLTGIYPIISLLSTRDGKRHERTLGLIRMIVHGYSGSSEASAPAIIKRLTEALAIELIDNVEHKRALGQDRFWHPSTADRSIAKALDLLHQDPQSDWTLERLARSVGYSRSVFAERFRSITGVTPMSYLTSIRINRALTMIEEGALSLSEIAHNIGYTSEAAFSRAFLREKGITPGRFRVSIQSSGAD